MAGRILVDDGGRALDSNGNPIARVRKAFLAGTSTPASLYTSDDLATPSSGASDSAGFFPQLWASDEQLLDIKDYAAADVGLTSPLRQFLNVSPQGPAGNVLFLQSGTGAVAHTVQEELRATLPMTPEQFGATGDGDDTAAFEALSAAFNSRGGGVISLQPGRTYTVGRQAANASWYLFGIAALSLDGCASVTIEGNGATIKFKGGMKYGAFNTGTGAPQDYGIPYTGSGAQLTVATQGVLVQAIDCGKIIIRNLNLDGNSANQIVGGRFGDTGRQVISYGIYLDGCGETLLENVHAQDFLLDCYQFGQPGLVVTDPPTPVKLTNVTGLRAGRNVGTLSGGIGLLADNCTFEKGGEAPVAPLTVPVSEAGQTVVTTSPASSWDTEVLNSVIRDVNFYQCKFLSGAYSNTCYVANSGDSADMDFDNCTFGGNFFVTKPSVRVRNSFIYGVCGRLVGGQTNVEENTLLENTLISDTPLGSAPAVTGNIIDATGAGVGLRLRNVTIRCSTTTLVLRSAQLEGTCNIDWRSGTGVVANLGTAIQMNGATVSGTLTITDNITVNIPATGFTVELPGALRGTATVISASSKLKWKNASTGYTGRACNDHTASYNPPSINAVATGTNWHEVAVIFDIPVSGANAVIRASFAGLNQGVLLDAAATSTTDGWVRFSNTTSAAIDPAAGELKVWEV